MTRYRYRREEYIMTLTEYLEELKEFIDVEAAEQYDGFIAI